ncbi:MAG: septum formation protein Maf [Chlamydiia bacterium]|nr:septum formation protein Maf [Chlamydiia bacterium]
MILGSKSPRRGEIIQFFSIPFMVAVSPFDEKSVPFQGDIEGYVREIAEKKGEALVSEFPDEVILTADTVVFFEGEIFHKPEGDGREMLQALSGNTHEVYTGLAVRKNEKVFSGVEKTKVTFNSIGEKEISSYIKGLHGRDKAGGYGAQEMGSLLIKRIEGCFYNVIGLPVNTLRHCLANVGIDLWDAFSS